MTKRSKKTPASRKATGARTTKKKAVKPAGKAASKPAKTQTATAKSTTPKKVSTTNKATTQTAKTPAPKTTSKYKKKNVTDKNKTIKQATKTKTVITDKLQPGKKPVKQVIKPVDPGKYVQMTDKHPFSDTTPDKTPDKFPDRIVEMDPGSRPVLSDTLHGGKHETSPFLTPGVIGTLRPGILDGLPGYTAPQNDFERLRKDCALTLLPVRLETIFTGGDTPRLLRIRVFPDEVHIDSHDPRLTPEEKRAGAEFWRRLDTANGDADKELAAHDWLIELFTEPRAAFVAQATRGSGNPRSKPKGAQRPALARCLPKFFRFVGFRRMPDGSLQEAFSQDGEPIPQDLCMDVVHGNADDPDAPAASNAKWLSDFNVAKRFGMGVDIVVRSMNSWLTTDGLALLLVYGVGAPATATMANRLEGLLSAHRYGSGLGFQAQGVPTNSVEKTRSGASSDPLAVDGTLSSVVTSGASTPGGASNAARLASVLGLQDSATLRDTPGADRDEDTPQGMMNEALWPVTFGQYFDKLLAGSNGVSALPSGARNYVRDAFLDDVRGGGPLPALRIGQQPYGVLPVRAHHVPTAWTTVEPWYEFAMVKLRDMWLEAAPHVAKLSPSGGQNRDEALDEVVRVLGAAPHPVRFLARRLKDWRTVSHDSPALDLLALFGLFFIAGDDPHFGHDSRSIMGQWGWARAMLGAGISGQFGAGLPQSEIRKLDSSSLGSADAQISALRSLRARLHLVQPNSQKRNSARIWIDYMIRQIEKHKQRLEPLEDMLGNPPLTNVKGVLRNRALDPVIAFHLYDNDPKEFTRRLVTSAEEQPEQYIPQIRSGVQNDRVIKGGQSSSGPTHGVLTARAPGQFHALGKITASKSKTAQKSTKPGSKSSARKSVTQEFTRQIDMRTYQFEGPLPSVLQSHGGFVQSTWGNTGDKNGPLLRQLLSSAATQLKPGERNGFKAALNGLKDLPAASLEWHMRETLGLASNRLDAWLTSLATRRMRDLSSTRRAQYGGYGFVLDLKPDQGAPESTGFVHAPSMQQATTAGILRSAWQNHGEGNSASPLAVNLKSERIRNADRLIQTTAQGLALGDVLGGDFERALHDAKLDVHLYRLREAVLAASGNRTEVRGPLDGLKLLEAYDADQLSNALARITPATARTKIKTLIEDTRAMFDALGDAGIAEATHYVAQGNSARAAAILDAISQGTAPPTELRHARTDISKSELSHWVMACLPDPRTLASDGEGRARHNPALNHYVQGLLPKTSKITLPVRSGKNTHEVLLHDLALSPLDLVMETARPGALGQRAMAYLIQKGVQLDTGAYVPSSLTGDTKGGQSVDPDLEDFEELCTQIAAHLGALRPALPEDLGHDDPENAKAVDIKALRASITERARRNESRVKQLAGAQKAGSVSRALRALLSLSLEGFAKALPDMSLLTAKDTAPFWAFCDQVSSNVIKRNDAIRQARASKSDLNTVLAALGQLNGNELPPEVPVSQTSLPFAKTGTKDAPGPVEILDWAGLYAHVRDDMRRWTTAFDTARLISGRIAWPLMVAQHSTAPTKGWLGTNIPKEGSPGGSSWICVDAGGAQPMTKGQATCAFVIDSWTERLPARSTTTGVNFHFDAPSSKAPQAILLAVTPTAQTGWSEDLLRRTLLETVENAQLRAVSNAELEKLGHHLPAIFVPGGVDAGPQPPKPEEDSQ